MEGQHMEIGPDSGVRTRSPGLGQRVVDLEVGSARATKPWGGKGQEQNLIPQVLVLMSDGNGLNLGLGRGSYFILLKSGS